MRLNLTLADDLPAVVANQIDIQQVIMNLVMNAVRTVKDQPEQKRWIAIETTQRN